MHPIFHFIFRFFIISNVGHFPIYSSGLVTDIFKFYNILIIRRTQFFFLVSASPFQ